MALDSIAEVRNAFYRLLGTSATDQALIEHDSTTLEALYQHLTYGFRQAQNRLIDAGLSDYWLKRGSAITTWTGSESSDGGRYNTLPSDFLRAWGDRDARTSFVQADNTPWGAEIDATEDDRRGNFYYFRNAQVWITRGASPPSTLYLRYLNTHPEITAATSSFEMPDGGMRLALAEAAMSATAESWFSGDESRRAAIVRELERQQNLAPSVARRTRAPRRMREQRSFSPHHFIRR